MQNTNFTVRRLLEADIHQLEPILRQHVRDRDTGEIVEKEVKDIFDYMHGKLDKYFRRRIYFVAVDNAGKVLGCMAYSAPEPAMKTHFSFDPVIFVTAELLNAFVDRDSMYSGVGRALFDAICADLRTQDYNVLVVNSGPRYKKSWSFYDAMGCSRAGYIAKLYGEGGDAMTWKKLI